MNALGIEILLDATGMARYGGLLVVVHYSVISVLPHPKVHRFQAVIPMRKLSLTSLRTCPVD